MPLVAMDMAVSSQLLRIDDEARPCTSKHCTISARPATQTQRQRLVSVATTTRSKERAYLYKPSSRPCYRGCFADQPWRQSQVVFPPPAHDYLQRHESAIRPRRTSFHCDIHMEANIKGVIDAFSFAKSTSAPIRIKLSTSSGPKTIHTRVRTMFSQGIMAFTDNQPPKLIL